MMPPHCADTALDRTGHTRHCSLEAGHEGDHMDWACRTWEPPGRTLQRLRKTWGRTHRVAYLPSGMWLATAYDQHADWRTEIEYTPDQLEERLQHHTHPSAPARRPL